MVSTTSAASSTTPTGNTGNTRSKYNLKTEDFIRMMITQLQNQDPMEPAKNEQLLAQMSQIAQLESSTQLSDSIGNVVLQNSITSAGAMIGKLVTGKDPRGEDISGIVTSVQVKDNKVSLELDSGKSLEITRVTEVAPARVSTAG
jgi:flagellar basal-body rod modification protein FlgD